jgi:hypothetical protein
MKLSPGAGAWLGCKNWIKKDLDLRAWLVWFGLGFEKEFVSIALAILEPAL